MWTFDMNRCNQCFKISDCPDRKSIHKTLSGIVQTEETAAGSRSGIIVMVCHEPNLLAKETEE